MDFMKLLVDQGVIIAAGLYVIGMFMKKTSFIPDWVIPFVLTVLGVIAAGFSIAGGFTVTNILQGVFAAAAAVLANQLIKQATAQDVGESFASKINAQDVKPSEDAGETDNSETEDTTEDPKDGSNGGAL